MVWNSYFLSLKRHFSQEVVSSSHLKCSLSISETTEKAGTSRPQVERISRFISLFHLQLRGHVSFHKNYTMFCNHLIFVKKIIKWPGQRLHVSVSADIRSLYLNSNIYFSFLKSVAFLIVKNYPHHTDGIDHLFQGSILTEHSWNFNNDSLHLIDM